MDYPESPQNRLENFWRAKLEHAGVHYSETPCIETKTTFLGVLKTFADLVLRGEAPKGSDFRLIAEEEERLRVDCNAARDALMEHRQEHSNLVKNEPSS